MKHLYPLISGLVLSISLCAQRTGVTAPLPYDSKLQDVYVSASGEGYTVGTCGVVLKTEDNGTTWSLLEDLPDGYDYYSVICPDDDCTHAVIAGSSIILRRLADGQWTTIGEGEDYADARKMHQVSPGVIVADRGYERYLRSTNEGKTWDIITPSNLITSDMYFTPGGIGYYHSTTTDRIYRSDDLAETWTERGELPINTANIHFITEDEGYAMSHQGELYKTTDGGSTWKVVDVENGPRGLLWMSSLENGYLVGIENVSDLFISRNGGKSWTEESLMNAPGTRPTFTNFHQRGDSFWVPSDGAEVFYSSAEFKNFTPQSGANRNTIRSVKFYNDQIAVAVGFETILKTADAGRSWRSISPGDFNIYNSLIFNSGTEYIISSTSSEPIITRDGGNTYENYLPTSVTDEIGPPGFIHKTPLGRIIVRSYEGYAFSDDGTSWTSVADGLEFIANNAFFVNKLVGYMVGLKQTVLKTTDGGKNWTKLDPVASGSQQLYGVYFTDEDNGYVSTHGRRYITTDGGLSWSAKLDHGILGAGVAPDGTLYVSSYTSGNNGTLYRSIDINDKWEPIGYGCAAFRCGALSENGETYIAAGDGGHIQRFDLEVVSLDPVLEPRLTLDVFPNPADELVTITNPSHELITDIRIYSMTGQIVLDKRVEQSETVLDISRLEPGVYIIRGHTAGDLPFSQKIMIN